MLIPGHCQSGMQWASLLSAQPLLVLPWLLVHTRAAHMEYAKIETLKFYLSYLQLGYPASARSYFGLRGAFCKQYLWLLSTD